MYLNLGERHEDIRSIIAVIKVLKLNPEKKNSGLNGIRTHDTGAAEIMGSKPVQA